MPAPGRRVRRGERLSRHRSTRGTWLRARPPRPRGGDARRGAAMRGAGRRCAVRGGDARCGAAMRGAGRRCAARGRADRGRRRSRAQLPSGLPGSNRVDEVRRLSPGPRHLPSPVPAFPGACLPRCLPSPVPAFPGACLPRCLPSPVPAFPGACLPRCLPSPVPAFPRACLSRASLVVSKLRRPHNNQVAATCAWGWFLLHPYALTTLLYSLGLRPPESVTAAGHRSPAGPEPAAGSPRAEWRT